GFLHGLLQAAFPWREVLLALQVFERVEATFFQAFLRGEQGAFDGVQFGGRGVADEFGVDEAGEVLFDVVTDGGLFVFAQLLFGVAVGGEDAGELGGELVRGGDESGFAAREGCFKGGAAARYAVGEADVFEQAGGDVVGECAVAADFAVVQCHLGVAGQVFAQVFEFVL
ncbi:hypothetical protein HMPREF9080_00621, partial [Cardiobacterium valvarum F0432]